MTKLFKPMVSWWRLWKKTKNINASYRLLPEVFTPVVETTVKRTSKGVNFLAYNKTYTHKQLAAFGKHGELLLKFLKSSNISFVHSDAGTSIVCIDLNEKSIRLYIHNYDNLKVIDEIFIDQLYDFHAPGSYVVCDVGMNVGAASLYFASFPAVEKVYGYEPFPQTYARAMENISLNTELTEKIVALNYGLGKSDEWLEVPQPSDGFLGGSTTGSFINQLPEAMKQGNIRVEVRNACQAIETIKRDHPGKKIILKLDCEGAEYDIMDELEKKGMTNDIAIYMIEFHFHGKKPLINTLTKNNFLVMSPVSDEVNLFGMLYAVKLTS